MLSLPNCVISYISLFLQARHVLALRLVCKKFASLKLNRFRLAPKAPLEPGNYDYVKTNNLKFIEGCKIRKLVTKSFNVKDIELYGLKSLSCDIFIGLNSRYSTSLERIECKLFYTGKFPALRTLKYTEENCISEISNAAKIIPEASPLTSKTRIKVKDDFDGKALSVSEGTVFVRPGITKLNIYSSVVKIKNIHLLTKISLINCGTIDLAGSKLRSLKLSNSNLPKNLPETIKKLVILRKSYNFLSLPLNLEYLRIFNCIVTNPIDVPGSVKIIKCKQSNIDINSQNARIFTYFPVEHEKKKLNFRF